MDTLARSTVWRCFTSKSELMTMPPSFKISHPEFKLNGQHDITTADLQKLAQYYLEKRQAHEQKIGVFLTQWLDNTSYITTTTSGSTGTPKVIKIEKQAMVNSAIMTGNFFKLAPKSTALHCLPMDFIAGKMMLLRAIVLGLHIDFIKPQVKLQIPAKPYDFCAMTPMQMTQSLNNSTNLKTILLGGARVSKTLFDALQKIPSKVYETFGMTETITHIALKQCNHLTTRMPYFETLPNVHISQDTRGCLIIKAPELSQTTIVTNDLVNLHGDTHFEWLGRYDNMINSGGVKLYPEQIEASLKPYITPPFFITSMADDTLGEKLILLIETQNQAQHILPPNLFTHLHKYQRPKAIYTLEKFVMTGSGKIHRKKTLELLNNEINDRVLKK